MTVKELIETLNRLPSHFIVEVIDEDGFSSELESVRSEPSDSTVYLSTEEP